MYRAFRRQTPGAAPEAPSAAPPPEEPDPAVELKAKLAEARSGSETSGTEEALDPGVEARRRSVHDRARSAIDEMQGSDPP